MFPRSKPRILQQQPPRHSDPQQQQAGSSDFQPKPAAAKPQQMGEGSYEGTRDYNQRTEEYLKKADVERDAAAAKPKSAEEARELEQAEEEGKSPLQGRALSWPSGGGPFKARPPAPPGRAGKRADAAQR
jgi:hypothetical protein